MSDIIIKTAVIKNITEDNSGVWEYKTNFGVMFEFTCKTVGNKFMRIDNIKTEIGVCIILDNKSFLIISELPVKWYTWHKVQTGKTLSEKHNK